MKILTLKVVSVALMILIRRKNQKEKTLKMGI